MNTTSYDPAQLKLAQSTFISKVYAWMSLALIITAVVAMYVASSEELVTRITGSRATFYLLIIAELGLVLFITAMLNRISAVVATLLFVLYSALNGMTLSVIFLVFTTSSISYTFFVTAGTFAVMSIYGYTTKRDLSSIGNLLVMALLGLVIATVVNLFFQSPAVYWICTYAGILIFTGLTAYDTQKIKEMWAADYADQDRMQKGAIMGALTLYLDFINLFLLLLRVFGAKKN